MMNVSCHRSVSRPTRFVTPISRNEGQAGTRHNRADVMEKRYQVFISSTFEDLKEERQSVLRAILELGHMPAGMELFPASDDDAWQLIRDVIDASDYYVLIIGGRYGSLDEVGISYTEKEYDYAVSIKKTVMPLLHENPDNLPRGKTETDKRAWNRLRKFRKKVEKKHTCVYWKSAEELKARVIVSLTAATKRHPATGWVRADQLPTGETLQELLALRKKIAELETEVTAETLRPPPGTEGLQQGEDGFEIHTSFVARTRGEQFPYPNDQGFKADITPTWDGIFAAVAPSIIDEEDDRSFRASIRRFFSTYAIKAFGDNDDLKQRQLREFKFKSDDVDTCVVQLRALGLIKASIRKRSVKDTDTYWTLTPYGDHRMVQLRARHRSPPPAPDGSLRDQSDESRNNDNASA